jgi:hypothetical protein
LKVIGSCPPSSHADELPLRMSPEDFIPKLAEASWKMRGILITRDKPVDLIKGKRGD